MKKKLVKVLCVAALTVMLGFGLTVTSSTQVAEAGHDPAMSVAANPRPLCGNCWN